MSQKVREEQRLLQRVGFPIIADGVAGPRTRQARRDFRAAQGVAARRNWRAYMKRLRWSAANGGKVSRWYPYLSYKEMKSKGNGWIKLKRSLVIAFHAVRKCSGPMRIISGYRDPIHNSRIGGASDSQHMYGTAVDVNVSRTCAERVSLIRGIGICSGTRTRVCHIDTRSQSYRSVWYY